jgi:hypothetical protein
MPPGRDFRIPEDAMTIFNDGDRVEHAEKGLGTITTRQSDEHFTVDPRVASMSADETVVVRWDDDRFPVGPVPVAELEPVSDLSAAISSGASD